MSSFIDSGAGLVSPMYMVHFSLNIEKQKQFYNYEGNHFGVVWYSYNKRTTLLRIYRHLLINRLHGKAAELCKANS